MNEKKTIQQAVDPNRPPFVDGEKVVHPVNTRWSDEPEERIPVTRLQVTVGGGTLWQEIVHRIKESDLSEDGMFVEAVRYGSNKPVIVNRANIAVIEDFDIIVKMIDNRDERFQTGLSPLKLLAEPGAKLIFE